MERFDSVPVIRHLDDVDDLRQFGRDGILLENQESEAKKYADELVDALHTENKQALLLLCSTRKRGVQTGEIISDEIKKRDSKIKVAIVQNESLANMYEGVVNLPDDYQAGDKFPGFVIGKKVFFDEVFGENQNLLYRFGDPVDLGDGNYKYPELKGQFSEYGESHRDFMVRLLNLVMDTAHNIERLHKKVKIVAITHSLQYQMFYDLQSIAEDIVKRGVEVDIGKVHMLCWEKYQERMLQGPPTYDVRHIDISNLCDPKIIEVLEKEIEYLSNLK